jgi:hypothetical protein
VNSNGLRKIESGDKKTRRPANDFWTGGLFAVPSLS